MKRKAFTWIEAIVVIAILMIGAAILFPIPTRSREGARGSSCRSNLKQIGLGFMQYAQDADTKAPPVANVRGGWMQLLQPYLKSEAIFQCPSAHSSEIGTTDYFFNARLAGAKNRLVLDSKAQAMTILSGEGAADADADSNLSQLPASWRTDTSSPAWRHLDGANYGFIDGHVKWFRAEKIFGAPDAATPPAPKPTFEVKP